MLKFSMTFTDKRNALKPKTIPSETAQNLVIVCYAPILFQ